MTAVLDLDGVAAPPRLNGELVFAEPWEGRAFGLVMTLVDRELLSYDDFRVALVDRITAWEAAPPEDGHYSYYRCWLQALERVLEQRSLISPTDISRRADELAARPAGHDHEHEHEHEHGHDHG